MFTGCPESTQIPLRDFGHFRIDDSRRGQAETMPHNAAGRKLEIVDHFERAAENENLRLQTNSWIAIQRLHTCDVGHASACHGERSSPLDFGCSRIDDSRRGHAESMSHETPRLPHGTWFTLSRRASAPDGHSDFRQPVRGAGLPRARRVRLLSPISQSEIRGEARPSHLKGPLQPKLAASQFAPRPTSHQLPLVELAATDGNPSGSYSRSTNCAVNAMNRKRA